MIPNLSKGMIDDMQQLRKRMRSEFGVELRLSQSDIIEQITELASRSKDHRTRMLFDHLQSQMGGDLAATVASSEPQKEATSGEDAPKQKIRVYRGCKIIEEVPPSSQKAEPQRIYRGQVVA